MTFLPKSLRAPEILGLLAAVPAAFAGAVLFAHMLGVSAWLAL